MGRSNDLTGRGLIRSSGSWSHVIAMRHDKTSQKSDERIPGDNAFVDETLAKAKEQMESRYI